MSHHPVVALESTIITHGMPYPYNLDTAMKVEELIRKEVIAYNLMHIFSTNNCFLPACLIITLNIYQWLQMYMSLFSGSCKYKLLMNYFCLFQGVIPATIAIVKGCLHAGLSHEHLHSLATKKDQCMKTSRRDFPYVLAKVRG